MDDAERRRRDTLDGLLWEPRRKFSLRRLKLVRAQIDPPTGRHYTSVGFLYDVEIPRYRSLEELEDPTLGDIEQRFFTLFRVSFTAPVLCLLGLHKMRPGMHKHTADGRDYVTYSCARRIGGPTGRTCPKERTVRVK